MNAFFYIVLNLSEFFLKYCGRDFRVRTSHAQTSQNFYIYNFRNYHFSHIFFSWPSSQIANVPWKLMVVVQDLILASFTNRLSYSIRMYFQILSQVYFFQLSMMHHNRGIDSLDCFTLCSLYNNFVCNVSYATYCNIFSSCLCLMDHGLYASAIKVEWMALTLLIVPLCCVATT